MDRDSTPRILRNQQVVRKRGRALWGRNKRTSPIERDVNHSPEESYPSDRATIAEGIADSGIASSKEALVEHRERSSTGRTRTDPYMARGMVGSLIGHLLVVYLVLVMVTPTPLDFREEVFSITIEGGKTLGGISQVPDESKESKLAVPRNVSEKEKELPKTIEETKEPEVAVPDKDAEVSLAKPTPIPAKPTPKPTAKAQPTKAPTPKATPKPKAPTKAQLDKEYQASMQKYLGESAKAGGKGFGAAKVGGTGMGGGALRPPEFFRYRDLLEAFVKGGWRWFDPQAKIKASVVFDIAPDGAVSNVRIDQSSGNREFDDSVLRAVYKANPVPKPPPSVYEQYFRTVRMIFEPE